MQDKETSRRGFIGLLVIAYSSIALYIGGALVSFLRFLFPYAIYEPPQKFKVGKPEDYPIGTITLITGRGLWIGSYSEWFAGLIAKCTHLGCKPNWFPLKDGPLGQGIFECPCHGSKYDKYARNFAGPAPFPLRRAKLSLAPDGRLEVDKTEVLEPKVKMQDGIEIDETKMEDFFLKI